MLRGKGLGGYGVKKGIKEQIEGECGMAGEG